ncbi:MAG: 30S ribosome-binding factor RbfA [Bacteroidetes bacterium]|nr:30S ribosome-binding factor RbfA [Bacteroidota bacterium]MCL5025297.1 30S ribosome-binding factor RbfA [Chloroflexota bacterium]
MSGRRVARINELIRMELAQIVSRELKTPLPGVVSITEVATSPDLRHAQVFVSIMGDEEARKASFASLQRATGFLRHMLAERLSLRYTPELTIHLDDSLERGARILGLLRDIEKQDTSSSQNAPPERP